MPFSIDRYVWQVFIVTEAGCTPKKALGLAVDNNGNLQYSNLDGNPINGTIKQNTINFNTKPKPPLESLSYEIFTGYLCQNPTDEPSDPPTSKIAATTPYMAGQYTSHLFSPLKGMMITTGFWFAFGFNALQ